MLNDFRNVDVIWDKATKNFVKKIRVASSDERGRKLTVQVVNGGQVEDLTGSSLSLYWITENKEHQGLDGFTQVDATQGIFEIYYTTEMLGNIGKLRANLHLIDEIGAVSSEQFFIEVFLGVDSEAVQSNDSFSALTQALAEVQTIKEDEIERVANEDLRVSAETERATAEEERVSNENERKTAETTRSTAENTRASNETDRVNAEETRKTNETNRESAESNRVTAETARVTAEEEREQGYPALDGRITAVEQNIDLLNVVSLFGEIVWETNISLARRVAIAIPAFRLVYIHAWIDISTATSSQLICTLPADYTPNLTRSFPWASKTYSGVIEVSTDGQIVAHATGSTTFNHCRIAGWIPY